jgi:archaellum component FlaC
VDELAPAEDVTKLDQRLKKVENAASKTSDRLEAIGKDVDDLQSRVEDLEQAAESGTDTTGTDTTETTP